MSRRPSASNITKAPAHPEFAPLSDEMIRRGMHTLGKHPILLNFTYLGLNITKATVKDFEPLKAYPNIMYLDISGNKAESIRVLGALPTLVQLNASDNRLTDCLDFAPVKCEFSNSWSTGHSAVGSMLTLVNLSNNRITHLRDLHCHPFLECLLLKKNQIARIVGLQSLRYLKVLDLSFNSLQNIEGLDDLAIEELSLEGNDLSSLDGLSQLPYLTTLNVSKNNIVSLAPLSSSASLTNLIAQDNKIAVIRQTEFLVDLPWLRVLELSGNPCCFKPLYRERVLFRLPNIVRLDLTVISPEEKIRSLNLYRAPGGDVESRMSVFATYFPDTPFEDSEPQFEDEETGLELEK